MAMRVSEFMLQLGNRLKSEREVSDSTANQYLQTLHILHHRAPFSNLAFLKDTEDIGKVLEPFAPNTQKGYITAIVSALSLFKDKPTYKKVYKYWYDKMMESKKDDTAHNNTKSAKQEANWIDWEEVQKVKNGLRDEVHKWAGGKHITPSQYDTLLRFVVLSLYADVAPRRNQDYMDMYVVRQWKEDLPKDRNYLDLAEKQFVFNKYKTAKTYGSQKVAVPNEESRPLWDALITLLKHHPLNKPKTKEFRLLVNVDGSPFQSVNAITRILNKVFGKKIGSSMLRHIYLTGKYGSELSEMKKDSEDMGHSLSTQKDYVLTKDSKDAE